MMDRRTFLYSAGVAGGALAFAPAQLHAAKQGFAELFALLRGHLIESFEKSKI